MNTTMPITDEERDAGAYVVRHKFGDHQVYGRSLSDLWEKEPETLIAMSKWRQLESRLPETFKALKRFFAVPRIGKIAALIIAEADAQKPRAVRTRRDQAHQWGM